ncbi:F390 synthetase-related protein [Deinococcus sp.]|uniref:F390 synthetase-related protein n=1 Tax=Deinococcus sp. TaxID=47478 RepID=UPI0025CC4F4C|nr:F390 synthetase-related protein [Deinococcus sp.]
MFERLSVLRHALGESRLMFTDRAALERHQGRLAARHLRWVAAHSADVARRLREAKLTPGEWRHLPPTDKAGMMEHFAQLNTVGLTLAQVLAVARRAEDTRDFSPTIRTRSGEVTVGLSSGTSGAQGAFLVSRAERLAWAGVTLRHLLPNWPGGLLTRQRVAFVLRAEGQLYRSVASSRLHFRFLDLLRPLPELAAELSSYNPTLLIGPPSVLRALLDAGALASPVQVVSVAEVLEDADKLALSTGFGPVVQVYQATEGLLGLPCAHGQLHLNEAHVHFDFEDVGGGYVRPVLTDLRRRAQPMIRHRLNDLLRLGDACPCGLAARRIESVAGRQDEALSLPSVSGGRVTVWPDFVRGALNRVAGLREYRAEQTAERTVQLQLEPDAPAIRATATEAVQAALQRLGVTETELSCGPLEAAVPGAKRQRVRQRWTPDC